MTDIANLLLINLEKVGCGAIIFLMAYVANILLGVWKNVKIEGYVFDWEKIATSAIKYVVLGFAIALLSITIALIPQYATYIGLELAPEILETIDSTIIVGSFLVATTNYAVDAIKKIKALLNVITE